MLTNELSSASSEKSYQSGGHGRDVWTSCFILQNNLYYTNYAAF